ncbi:hypothetical protein QBC39DRAFT_332945 [Podospora conica]|nr:hypothetical protein QBC39DRAFT_332945 [Schizothecium conicum]
MDSSLSDRNRNRTRNGNRSNLASRPNLRSLAPTPTPAPVTDRADANADADADPDANTHRRPRATGDVNCIVGHVESIVGHLAPIQAHKDALESFLTVGGSGSGSVNQPNLQLHVSKSRSTQKALADRARCQKQWNISAEELDSLRPTKGLGGESYYRALHQLSATPEGRGWERARLLLLAARDTRAKRRQRGIRADLSISVDDVKTVLSSLLPLQSTPDPAHQEAHSGHDIADPDVHPDADPKSPHPDSPENKESVQGYKDEDAGFERDTDSPHRDAGANPPHRDAGADSPENKESAQRYEDEDVGFEHDTDFPHPDTGAHSHHPDPPENKDSAQGSKDEDAEFERDTDSPHPHPQENNESAQGYKDEDGGFERYSSPDTTPWLDGDAPSPRSPSPALSILAGNDHHATNVEPEASLEVFRRQPPDDQTIRGDDDDSLLGASAFDVPRPLSLQRKEQGPPDADQVLGDAMLFDAGPMTEAGTPVLPPPFPPKKRPRVAESPSWTQDTRAQKMQKMMSFGHTETAPGTGGTRPSLDQETKSLAPEFSGADDEINKSHDTSDMFGCLLDPKGWLTAGAMTALLDRVSAGSPYSVCVADVASMESEVSPYMLSCVRGCLEAATGAPAEVILLPIHISKKHWVLATLPLSGNDPIELFDSLPTATGTDDPRLVVERFLGQLVAAWPEVGARPLPAPFQQHPPCIVPGACPEQPNTYDCGVNVVVTAMHLIAGKRVPRQYEWRLWRRVLCFVSGVLEVPPASDPRDMQPLLGGHPDWRTLDPNAAQHQPPQPPEPGPGSTFDDLKRYQERLVAHAQLVDQQIRAITAEQAKCARRLEESLTVMGSVLHGIAVDLGPENPEVAEMERELHAERCRGGVQDGGLMDHIEKKVRRARIRIANAAPHVRVAYGVVRQALDGLDGLLRPKQGKLGQS